MDVRIVLALLLNNSITINLDTFMLILVDPFVQWLRQNTFTVKIRVQIPYGLIEKKIKRILKGISLIGKATVLHTED